MLAEASVSRLIGFAKGKIEKTPVKAREIPSVKLEWGKLPDAEVIFGALIQLFTPMDLTKIENFKFLSEIEPTYHEANGFFFKIDPVVTNDDKTRIYMIERIERRANQHDNTPIDRLEITRNNKNPDDPGLSRVSYRKQVLTDRGLDLICLSEKDEIKKKIAMRQTVEAFIGAMTTPQFEIPTEID